MIKRFPVTNYQLPITFLIYSALAILFTWPLILHLSTSTYGYSGDSFGSIYYFWWWKHTFLNHLPFRINPLQEAPFGVTFDQETGVIFFYWPVKLLSLFTNAVFAYNFILVLSFPLAGLAMYLLIKEVLCRRDPCGRQKEGQALQLQNYAAFLCGLIFTLCPYHYWKAFQHLDLALTWCLPFFIYTLIRFERNQNLKNSLLMAFGFLTTVLTNYYYGYFALLLVAIFGAIRLIQRPKRYLNKEFLSFSALSFFCILAIAGFLTYPVIKDARQAGTSQESFVRRDSYQRPFLNLVSLSARPWDYLVPSQDHPLWGKYIPKLYEWIQNQGSDFKTVSTFPHERTIYLGIATTLCALLSVLCYLKRRIRSDLYLPFLITAAAFFLISMPPYIFLKGRTIWLPSSFLYRFFPMFRSYVRAGVMVLICLLVAAAFGLVRSLGYLCSRDPRGRQKEGRGQASQLQTKILLCTTISSLVIILDFLNIPPFKITKFLPLPPAYAWLKDQPDEPIIIEYPQSFNVADGLLYQMYHQKPFLNFHTHSPYFGLWTNISDFYNFRTPEKLAALGVKYALIHKKLLFPQENPVDGLWYTRALKEPLDYNRLSPEFKLMEDFPETAVYEVVTEYPPKMIVVTQKADEIRAEAVGGPDWRWEKEENRLYIMNLASGDATMELRATLTLTLESNPKGWKNIKAISFNGEIIEFGSSLDLTLKPGENILLFEGKRPSLWEFSNIRLEIL